MKITVAVFLSLIYITVAEPPSNKYGAPSQTQAIIKPNGLYGAPPSNSYGPPSNRYGPPRNQYGPPGNKYGPPSNQYGAPSNQYGAPSNQYGAPSNQYGAPSNQYGAPSNQYGAPSSQYGVPSAQYGPAKEEEAPASYQFEYHVEDAESGNDFGHEEQREGDVATGKYYVLLPDGRRQTVEYTADSEGYKPQISYEQVRNGGYAPAGYPAGGYNYYLSSFCFLSAVCLTFAEPPAPNGLYGAPKNSYVPPSNGNGPSSQYGPPSNQYGPPSGTYLPAKEEEEAPASYQFEYRVQDEESGNDFGHEEQREGDVATGKYFVLLPDGRQQTVEYTADNDGYKPKITYQQVRNNGGYAPAGYPAEGYKY